MNARTVALLVPLILTWGIGCATVPARNPVFVDPAKFVGEDVEICGWFDGPNILESRNREDWAHTGGVSITDRGPLAQGFSGYACVEGALGFLGCETQLCTGAAFEYAIRITRVVSR